MSPYVSVVLPRPLRGPLIYQMPEALRSKAIPGCRVKIPLGTKKMIGCLLALTNEKPSFKTKDVLEILDDAPLLSAERLKLLSWASAYYLTPIGEVLRHLLPPKLLHLKESSRASGRKTLEAIESDSFHAPDFPSLSQDQKEAVRVIRDETQRPLLLHGVTGSGKTEIYIETVQEILKEGGQALILVPEIGLTPQILGRFRRLSHQIAAYHSGLTEAQRYKIWEEVRSGKISIVIATRSGFFLPFPNLKLIVIDEEHDTSYKQEERFCYHARDLALWLGREGKIKVVLGSATPSIESLYRVETGKMRLVSLPERPVGSLMPTLEVVDRRSLYPQKDDHPLLSERLLDLLRNTLKKKEQSLLFMNRRGFSPFVLCAQCGFVPRCKQCDISLTLHKGPHALVCH
ncbi:MAG: primosomal protein N', partial [Deltaproteobacteria bacterium]|nr:primosomal protein N' [Deltaproteobacteria bacterium]